MLVPRISMVLLWVSEVVLHMRSVGVVLLVLFMGRVSIKWYKSINIHGKYAGGVVVRKYIANIGIM